MPNLSVYYVEVNGRRTSIQLTDEDARRRGLLKPKKAAPAPEPPLEPANTPEPESEPVVDEPAAKAKPARKSRKTANKAHTPQNKDATGDDAGDA